MFSSILDSGVTPANFFICIGVAFVLTSTDKGDATNDPSNVISSDGKLTFTGTLTITAQSPFDYDGEAKYTGGTMIINGETTTEITNQFANGMGGMMPGGQAGQGDGQANGQQGTPPQGNQGGQAPPQQGGTNTRQL